MFTPHNMSHVMCHVSHVTCHVSHVTSYMSCVMCPMSPFFFVDKVVKLIGGRSVINGAYPVLFQNILASKYATIGTMSKWGGLKVGEILFWQCPKIYLITQNCLKSKTTSLGLLTVLLSVRRICRCYSDRHLGQSLTQNIRSSQSPR